MRTVRKAVMAVCALALWAAQASAAPKTMTVLSSATYNSSGTDAVYAAITDADGNLYVTGASGNDYLTRKYSKGLVQLDGNLYTNGRSGNTPYGIAQDGQGNVIVAGVEINASNEQDYLVLKYSPSFVQMSSAVYDGGPVDVAKAVVTDSQDNVYVTGYTNNGTNDFYTIKYNSSLVKLATAAYDSGFTDQAAALALAGDYLIVAGYTKDGETNSNIRVVRYDSGLKELGSASFDSGGGNSDISAGVAVDPSGNIIVLGRSVAATADFLLLKYDSLLNLISSATYDSGLADQPNGVTVDSAGNIIATGYSGNGGAVDFLTLKYDNSLNLISSATYDGGGTDKAYAAVVDAEDNVFTAGSVYNANDDFFIIKYNASPKLTEVSPLYIGETSNVTFKGFGLVAGSSITFADTGISTGIISVQTNQITLSVSPSSSVLLGVTTVTVTAANGEEVTDYTLAATRLKNTVAAGQSASISAMLTEGQATVTIPAGTFAQQELITLYTVPADASARQVGQALYLSVSPAVTPLQNITITMHYRESDLGTTAESALALAYYDATDGWVSLTSSLNSSANTATAVTREINTKYSVVKPAGGNGGGGTVPGGMGGAKVYPSPYRPGSGGDFDQSALGDGIVFAGLGANQAIKITIVDLAGQLVYQKSAVANADGKWLWDTKTATGGVAATGVYIYMLKGAGQLVTGKLSIIR